MSAAFRFPRLTVPFAIVGATGGWLSANLLANPIAGGLPSDLRWAPCVIAAGITALLGALLTRWATWSPPEYYFSHLGFSERRWTKHWLTHSILVLFSGAATGGLVGGLRDNYGGPAVGALFGVACAFVFVPVCLVVLSAARRAERARLGSLVSASDRMAVWGILATALSFATLEALPDWPAAGAAQASLPLTAIFVLGATALLLSVFLVMDLRRLRKVKETASTELVPRDPESLGASDAEAPRLDLGLGEEMGASVARGAAVYRERERTLWLVQGDVAEAARALRRAVWRGVFGLFVVAVVASLHWAARGETAQLVFDEERCESWDVPSCARVAKAVETTNPERAMLLYSRACSVSSTDSCVALARMYLSDAASGGRGPDSETESFRRSKAAEYFARACRLGDWGGCRGAALMGAE